MAETRPSTVVEAAASDAGHGERLHDVVQQAVHAAGKDAGLALFGVIALDDAHAAQRLGEAAGDLGVDLAALAEDGADDFEGRIAGRRRTRPGQRRP